MQLIDIGDSKESVYGALDAWVAWEKKFPIVPLKIVIISLEEEEQWHRVVQVSVDSLSPPILMHFNQLSLSHWVSG